MRWRAPEQSLGAALGEIATLDMDGAAVDVERLARAERTAAWQFRWVLRFGEAARHARRVLDLRGAGIAEDVLADACATLGLLHFFRGEYAEGLDTISTGMGLIGGDARAETRIDLLANRSAILRESDDATGARDDLTTALEISKAADAPLEEAHIAFNLACLEASTGQLDVALVAAEQAEALAMQHDGWLLLSHISELIGFILAQLGRFEEAERRLSSALKRARERQDSRAACQLLLQLGLLGLERGNSDMALHHVFEGEAIARSLNDAIWISRCNALRSRVAELDFCKGAFAPRPVNGERSEICTTSVSPAHQMVNGMVPAPVSSQSTSEQERDRGIEPSLATFAGGTAHAFNNLLAVISGNAELLLSDADNSTSYVQEINASVTRGKQITGALLAYSEKLVLSPDTLKLAPFLALLETEARRELSDAFLLELSVNEDTWDCHIDAQELKTGLHSLLRNACEAMPDGGRIHVEVRNVHHSGSEENVSFARASHGDYVEIRVCDNGPGMEGHVLARAYDPFFTTKPIGRNTGVGLSHLAGFLRQSGGDISIVSKAGEGTSVGLLLPRSKPLMTQPDSTNRRSAGPDSLRLALIEDDPLVMDYLSKALEKLGHDTICFSSAELALAHIEQLRMADVVITDIQLGGRMNGFGLAASVRERIGPIKVIYISGFFGEHIPKTEAGQAALLQKPFSIMDLRETIDRLVAGPAE